MEVSIKQRKSNYFMVSLCLILLVGTYYYGLRVLFLAVINVFAAITLESIYYKQVIKLQKSTLVTTLIYTLIIPASLPFHISVLGLLFGLFFGKIVFGGDNYYIFSPALVGRVFLHVSFAQQMSSHWIKPASNPLGGFVYYLGEKIDTITSATPLLQNMWVNKETDLIDLLLGKTAGSIGETSALIILIIASILLIRRVISATVFFSSILSATILCTFYFFFMGETNFTPLHHLLSGGFLFGVVFIATDPTTMPKASMGKLIYGVLIGVICMSIRLFATSTEGMMFAILIANMISPFIDYVSKPTESVKSKLKGGGY